MLTVNLQSFSYRKGVPVESPGSEGVEHGGGFVFDCRCVENPGRHEKLKMFIGTDPEVNEFLEAREDAREFYALTSKLVFNTIDSYLKRGFTYLSVSYGCTGGRHRSVYFANKLAGELRRNPELKILLSHREQEQLKSG